MKLPNKEILFLGIGSIIFSLVLSMYLHNLLASIFFGMCLFSIFVFISYKNSQLIRYIELKGKNNEADNKKKFYNIEKNIEGLASIFSTLKIPKPLPFLSHYAITPDFASILLDYLHKKRPSLVVEASSGVSTLICGYFAKNFNPEMKIISLEHEKKYAKITEENVKNHDLEEFVDIVYAPLTSYELKNQEYLWYSLSEINFKNKIDFLIIDGPPRHLQPHSRYPAYPLLKSMLNSTFTILLDDAARKDEKEIVEKWQEENDHLRLTYYENSKGLSVLEANV